MSVTLYANTTTGVVYSTNSGGLTEVTFAYDTLGQNATLTSFLPKAYAGALVIPSTIGGYTVTATGLQLFAECANLTSVTIPASVTSIGGSTFYQCTGITQVIFAPGSQVTSIGNRAFVECIELTSITIPDSVTAIENYAFQSCFKLETVTFLGNVPTLGNTNVFKDILISATAYYLSNTNSVNLATYFSKRIQYSVDGSNASITSFLPTTYAGALVIPGIIGGYTVTSIANNLFQNYTTLTSITIPASVTSIGNFAFYDCTSLTSITFAADSQLTTIGAYAFAGCVSLATVTFAPG